MDQKKNTQQSTSNTKRKKKAPKKRVTFGIAAVYTLFILGISMILAAIAIVTANDVFALVKANRAIEITLPEDASPGQVAKILDKSGVIAYSSVFRLFMVASGGDMEFGAGIYELNSNMDYRALTQSLRKTGSRRGVVSITIPEGYNTEQVVEALLEKRVCDEDELWDTISNYEFKFSFLQDIELGEKNRLEGYLFPDTYEFYEGDEPVNVINKMLLNFDMKYTDELREITNKTGYSMYDIVTIASLIEREAKLEEERAKIGGVIYNRLKNSAYPFLNIDATVQYAVGHNKALTVEDLKIDSPYNTYIYEGLPPGPIANPGFDSIYAALYPEKHGYYFYVANKDGSHVFTTNIDEHNAAVATIASQS